VHDSDAIANNTYTEDRDLVFIYIPALGTATSTEALDAEATGASASEGGSARALCAAESITPALLKAANRLLPAATRPAKPNSKRPIGADEGGARARGASRAGLVKNKPVRFTRCLPIIVSTSAPVRGRIPSGTWEG